MMALALRYRTAILLRVRLTLTMFNEPERMGQALELGWRQFKPS